MDAWTPDVHIKTDDYTQWTHFLNLTMEELRLGPLPPDVAAIPGEFTSTSYTDPGTRFVIQYADEAKIDGAINIEEVVFLVSSGVVILMTIIWALWHRKEIKSRWADARNFNSSGSRPFEMLPVGNTTGEGPGDGGSMDHGQYLAKLRLYYAQINTLPEVEEKRPQEITAEEIEDVNELLRNMFAIDIDIETMRNETELSPQRASELGEQSDKLLAEVRRRLDDWRPRHTRTMSYSPGDEGREEMKLFEASRAILLAPNSHIPNTRHSEAGG